MAMFFSDRNENSEQCKKTFLLMVRSIYDLVPGAQATEATVASPAWIKSKFPIAYHSLDLSTPCYIINKAGLHLEESDMITYYCLSNGVFDIRWRNGKCVRIICNTTMAIVQEISNSSFPHSVSTGSVVPSPVKSFIEFIEPSHPFADDSSAEIEDDTSDIEMYDSDFDIMFSQTTHEIYVGSYQHSWMETGSPF